jgi:hypothetical protein
LPEYLVELYTATDPDPGCASSPRRRIGSPTLPLDPDPDETSLHLFEAESAERVSEGFEQAGLAANRIVEAVNLQAPATVGHQRRKS